MTRQLALIAAITIAAMLGGCVTAESKLAAITRAEPPPPILNEAIPLGNGQTLTRQTVNPAYVSYMQALSSIKTAEDHASDVGRTFVSSAVPVAGQVLLNRDTQAANVDMSAINAGTQQAMWGTIGALGLQGDSYDLSNHSDNSNQNNATAPAQFMPPELLRDPIVVPTQVVTQPEPTYMPEYLLQQPVQVQPAWPPAQ